MDGYAPGGNRTIIAKASGRAQTMPTFPPGPPEPRGHSAHGKAKRVDEIRHASMEIVRTEPLEEDAPHRDVQCYLPPSRRLVVRPKSDLAVDEEIDRQRNGHRQAVVEMTVKKGRIMMEVGLNHQPIEGVRRETSQKERITPVSKVPRLLNWHRE